MDVSDGYIPGIYAAMAPNIFEICVYELSRVTMSVFFN
jgi:hypothetical protein